MKFKKMLFLTLIAVIVSTISLSCFNGNGSGNGQITPIPSISPIPTPVHTPTITPTPTPAKATLTSPFGPDKPAPLLDKALNAAGMEQATFGFTKTDLLQAEYYNRGYLNDEFLLSWFRDVWAKPGRLSYFEKDAVGPLDQYLSGPYPVANTIKHAARLLDRPLKKDFSELPPENFDQALNALLESIGEYGKPEGEIPQELKQALAPILSAIRDGIEARKIMDAETSGTSGNPDWWQKHGGNLIFISGSGQSPNILNAKDRSYLLGKNGRQLLYEASAKIAFAIENTNWSKFSGMQGLKFDLWTKAGWIKIRDSSNHIYDQENEEILLLIDLGGDDVYLNGAGSNQSGANSVSIVIDLSGNDTYAYKAIQTPYDRTGLLPSDIDGRYPGDNNYGNISVSEKFRQGAARNGIAMLFDFGKGDDHYQSLRGSQGYAHLGVGVLYDNGGNDVYLSEFASQGSAQFGIGILIDKGDGNDKYSSFSNSQGFGYVAGAGIIVNEGGDDEYFVNPGDPKYSGIPLYHSPQLAGKANTSLSQGASSGYRGDSEETEVRLVRGSGTIRDYLSGGIGILRDIKGNDKYIGSVFAQGVGYWQGTGILSDGSGNDSYDALYYAQGSGVHYAVGILIDGGEGDDIFNKNLEPITLTLGAGNDYSVGFFLNESGNDEYFVAEFSAGTGFGNAIGFFIDNAGDDKYNFLSKDTMGIANHGPEYLTRLISRSIGVMIDAAGKNDIYEIPANFSASAPENNKSWLHSFHNIPSERGVSLDEEGETGIHSGY